MHVSIKEQRTWESEAVKQQALFLYFIFFISGLFAAGWLSKSSEHDVVCDWLKFSLMVTVG